MGVGQICEQASVYDVAKPLCGKLGLKHTTSLILPPLTNIPQQSVYEQSILSTVPETQQGYVVKQSLQSDQVPGKKTFIVVSPV